MINQKEGKKVIKKHRLEKFKDEEITEICEHSMETCPCCNSDTIKKDRRSKRERRTRLQNSSNKKKTFIYRV